MFHNRYKILFWLNLIAASSASYLFVDRIAQTFGGVLEHGHISTALMLLITSAVVYLLGLITMP